MTRVQPRRLPLAVPRSYLLEPNDPPHPRRRRRATSPHHREKKSKKLKGTQKSSAGVSFSADLAGESLVKKMKVIQLRAELEKRNVSLKKQVAKPLLISMLLSAMAEDKEN